MIELTTPRGLKVRVPETAAEDPSPHFDADQTAQIRQYYDAHGYVVVHGLVAPEDCDGVRALWDSEVKPASRPLYRQGARPDGHIRNAQGWVMNAILNVQSVNPRHFGRFRDFATSKILTARRLADGFAGLLDDRPKIVQSMYFEGNAATSEHQDTYYLDSERMGTMAAAWIAVEDIDAQAGRFFVCVGSHRLDMGVQRPDNNIAEHHDVYIDEVVAAMRRENYEIRAPRLEKGEVLFWNARTMHGSLDSQSPDRARSSITCHAIPASDRFLQLQMRALDVPTDEVNGVSVYRPKDQARALNRAILWGQSRFPRQFAWAKKMAVNALLRLRRRRAQAPSPAPSSETVRGT